MMFARTQKILWPAVIAAFAMSALVVPAAQASPACSVTAYGAIAGDSVDDTAAIQASLSSGCGVVSLPSGTYIVSDTLRVPSGGGLKGAGTLRQAADVVTILNADTVNGNSDITLDGFKIAKDFVNNSLADGLRLERVDGATVKGLEITGVSARSGIELLRSSDFTVTRNYLHGYSADQTGALADGDPISIDSIYIRLSSGGTVSHNRIEDMVGGPGLQSDGIFVTGDDVVVEYNVIRNVGEAVDVGAADNVTVRYNRATDISGWGLKIGNGSSNSVITRNYVERAQLAGIVVFNGASTIAGNGPTENIEVTFNTIVNTGSQDKTTHAIPFIPRAGISLHGYLSTWAPVANTTVRNNVIIDTYRPHRMEYGIWEDLNNVDNTISNNVIIGAVKQQIRDDATPWCTESTCEEY
jgi:hypothetical protein